MKRRFLSIMVVIAAVGLVAVGCGQSAPPATPTKAPSAPTKAAEPTKPAAAPAPTKAAEPTKAATAAPTAAPAKKVDFPAAGKAISMIVPFAAGGGTDVGARLLAAEMEKALGGTVQVLNKPGAGTQIGHTDLAQAKPDGYTVGFLVLPTIITTYLDPDRKAVFGRKDFEVIGMHVIDPVVTGVKADSPYKDLKDLLDAAKAAPEKIKVSNAGFLGDHHMAMYSLEKMAGVRFAHVQTSGGAEQVQNLLGGHVDATAQNVAGAIAQVKGGGMRILGVADNQESPFLPGVKTFEAQGYGKLYFGSVRPLAAPAGTPKEILDILKAAFKKAMESEELKRKTAEGGMALRYMDPAQVSAYWDDLEAKVKPLWTEMKQKQQ